MAFSNALNGRMEELRFPGLRSPDTEASFAATLTSNRDSNPFFPTTANGNTDVRGTLQRRFTTDSSKLPLGRSSFGAQQYNPINSATQLKQKQIFEDIQDARRKAQEQLALLDLQERNLQLGANGQSQELERLNSGFNRISLNGPVSEPTTPPDYSEDVFSNRFSRSSRVSMSNIASPPGLTKRVSQNSTKVTSPPSTRMSNSNAGLYQSHRQSTKSMPGSRRGSDEDEDYPETLPNIRSAAALNRFSMPIHGTRANPQRLSMINGQTNGLGYMDTSFFMDDNDGLAVRSPVAAAYNNLVGGQVGEDFPTLRNDGNRLSANSVALDLTKDDWSIGSRARPGHASMPHDDSSMYRPVLSNLSSPPERPAEIARRQSQRHSMGVTFVDSAAMPPNAMPTTRPASLQSSYSTNDVHTMKSLGLDAMATPPKSQAEQQFHAHNVSMGRIPPNGVSNRQSREVGSSNGLFKNEDKPSAPMSSLQASAASFGPTYTSTADSTALPLSSPVEAYNTQPVYPYGMPSYNVNQMTTQPSMNGPLNGYQNPMGVVPAYGRPDAPARGVAGRRNGNNDESRFNNVPLESYRGSLYELCKDQHGCRYLQRKLEDGNSEHIEAIFMETYPHIIELMTDPFGNYLCQKLFEHCSEEQRSTLIDTAAPALTVIALNQHGTRALQKMIEFVHTDDQINTIIRSLSERVVELVQDLNGNHVIQKCLTRLGAERAQFIYDAVGYHCVVVGTHRHGCCVLQRCIDHARGAQRAGLISQITQCAFDLVQDPFGNYVVQYILDLDEMAFTRPLCQSFKGKIVALSKQKFSSNVIEKCLRTADMETKKEMIDEMLMGAELEKMLRDSFANYVVQTALDYADAPLKARMIDCIRPILPLIKQTPHGRRIASKIMGMGSVPSSGPSSGTMTPSDSSYSNGRSSNRRQVQINGGGFVYGAHGGRGYPANEFPAESYASGQPGVVHPLGYSPHQPSFNSYGDGQFGNNYI